jgi:hypothetical protein
MQQRAGSRFLIEILHAEVSKVEIAGIEDRSCGCFQHSELHVWADHDCFNCADGQHEKHGCGKKPTSASRVKPGEVEPAGRFNFLDEKAGDEKAGEDKEDVNADKATAEKWESCVRDDNEDDCEGA